MKTVTTHEAKTHLSSLLREVSNGEEITILRGDVPVAKIVTVTKKSGKKRPKVGKITSEKIKYSKDAFLPLSDEELKEWGF